MAITDSIDVSLPDGTVQYVRDLDDAIRTHKRQVEERMEDATQGLIAGDWSDTSTKELKEGIGRLFTDTRANQAALTRLVDGKVFIATDPLVTGVAFQYYTGAAWVDVPIATANIMADAITTAKIANSTGAADGVTTAKLATNAVTVFQTEFTSSGLVETSNVAYTLATGFTQTITPNSTSSYMCLELQAMISISNAAEGQIRIQNTTAAVTIAEMQTLNFGSIPPGGPYQFITLRGYDTGRAGAQTYEVQYRHTTGGGANRTSLRGDVITSRYNAWEIKR